MRRVGVVLLCALAAAGCTRTTTVPGAAAPLTASGTAASPSPSAPAVPTDFQPLTMTGFGSTVTLSVPKDWTQKPTSSAALIQTDVDLGDPEVLLRIDLSPRGPGSAVDSAVRGEKGTKLDDYQRVSIKPVDGVGEDAADWTFTFVRTVTRQVVDRKVLDGGAEIAVYYSAPTALYQQYLPVWDRAVRDLDIRTS